MRAARDAAQERGIDVKDKGENSADPWCQVSLPALARPWMEELTSGRSALVTRPCRRPRRRSARGDLAGNWGTAANPT
jgi:hypothetical protein